VVTTSSRFVNLSVTCWSAPIALIFPDISIVFNFVLLL